MGKLLGIQHAGTHLMLEQRHLIAGATGLVGFGLLAYYLRDPVTGRPVLDLGQARANGDPFATLDPRALTAPWLYAPWAAGFRGHAGTDRYRAWLAQYGCTLAEKSPGHYVWTCTASAGSGTKEARTGEQRATTVLAEFARQFALEHQAYMAQHELLASSWLAKPAATATPAAPATTLPETHRERHPRAPEPTSRVRDTQSSSILPVLTGGVLLAAAVLLFLRS